MIADEIGNKLFRKENTIFLKLASEGFSRKLGVVDEDSKNFVTTRVYKKHLYRNTKSFGFNLEFLKSATMFSNVKLITDKKEIFIVPVKFIIEQGDCLHFKKKGFEKQIFIKVEQLNKFKI